MPQFSSSICVFTQAPAQLVVPAGQRQVDVTHVCPNEHARPQAPQLKKLSTKFTQTFKHAVCPAGQALHVPPEQTCPDAHTRPHAPQLFRSVAVNVHTPPQRDWPPRQLQVPITHCSPVGQTVLQPPQLNGSVWLFVQRPAQAVCPAGHAAHAPARQACPAGQTLPHMPQLNESVWRLTQAPLHDVDPIGHAHVPALQVSPTPQSRPHMPQFVRSVIVFVHVPPHTVVPAGHIPHTPPMQP